MPEEDPFEGADGVEPTKVLLDGPNVTSTFDTPPSPDAVKTHEAAIRKHLSDQQGRENPPAGPR
jgi:hypothetical protein